MDVARIVGQLEEAVRATLDGFEQRNGYPPGENAVVAATGPDRALTAEFGDRVPAEVLDFFGAVSKISLPDLWNGYFIGPAEWSAGLHRAGEPRAIRFPDGDHEVLVFAANGGGVMYGLLLEGEGGVYVMPSSSFEDGAYLADSPMAYGFRRVAGSFGEFLEELATAALARARDPFDPYR